MTASEQLSKYQTAKTGRDIKLDESGIGHDFVDRFNETIEVISRFCAELQTKANRQALYDLTTNVPCGVLSHWEANASHAIERAIVSMSGAFVKWDISHALRLAGSILEDVNAHGEAKMLFDMADGKSTSTSKIS